MDDLEFEALRALADTLAAQTDDASAARIREAVMTADLARRLRREQQRPPPPHPTVNWGRIAQLVVVTNLVAALIIAVLVGVDLAWLKGLFR